jgi:hypothetical protein
MNDSPVAVQLFPNRRDAVPEIDIDSVGLAPLHPYQAVRCARFPSIS